MWQWKIIEFNEWIDDEKNIFTHWLGWCTATVIYFSLKDWTKKVILTHFPPISIEANLNTIRNLAKDINISDIEEFKTLYFFPKDYWTWKNDRFLEALKSEVNSIFWKNDYTLKKYSMNLVVWVKDQWVLSVKLNKDWVFYRFWEFDFWRLDWEKEKQEKEEKINQLKNLL